MLHERVVAVHAIVLVVVAAAGCIAVEFGEPAFFLTSSLLFHGLGGVYWNWYRGRSEASGR